MESYLPFPLFGFFITVALLLLIMWLVRKFGTNRVIGIALIAIFVLTVRTTSLQADNEDCDIQPDEPCERSNSQFGLLESPIFWTLMSIFYPDTVDSYVNAATRKKSYSNEILAGLDESARRQIWNEMIGCWTKTRDAVPSSTARWDPDMYLRCRDELAADYGLTRDDLAWIEDRGNLGDFSSLPPSESNSADSASLEVPN